MTVFASLSVENQRVIDKICDDFEASWQQGHPLNLGHVLSSVPVYLMQSALPELQRIQTEYESLGLSASHAPKLLGDFHILRELGRGKFGRVFLAENQDGLKVAIKIPHSFYFCSTESRDRFLREAEIIAGVDHEHIAPIYGCGQTEWGSAYIVAKYVDGRDLSAVQLNGNQSLVIMAGVARAIDHLHQSGFAHLDVKPSNILLSSDLHPFLADFGLAASVAAVSSDGASVGTPNYMSPEQLSSDGSVSAKSDIFSLGVILYELLTGVRPFKGGTLESRLQAIQSGEWIRLSKRVAVSHSLDNLCTACLSVDSADRPDGKEVSEALEKEAALWNEFGLKTVEKGDFREGGFPTPHLAVLKDLRSSIDVDSGPTVLSGVPGVGKSRLVRSGLIPLFTTRPVFLFDCKEPASIPSQLSSDELRHSVIVLDHFEQCVSANSRRRYSFVKHSLVARVVSIAARFHARLVVVVNTDYKVAASDLVAKEFKTSRDDIKTIWLKRLPEEFCFATMRSAISNREWLWKCSDEVLRKLAGKIPIEGKVLPVRITSLLDLLDDDIRRNGSGNVSALMGNHFESLLLTNAFDVRDAKYKRERRVAQRILRQFRSKPGGEYLRLTIREIAKQAGLSVVEVATGLEVLEHSLGIVCRALRSGAKSPCYRLTHRMWNSAICEWMNQSSISSRIFGLRNVGHLTDE